MQKIRLAIAVIILIALIITSFYINSKSNSRTYASGVDVTDSFKDENLKNAIIELAEEATEDNNIKRIYESDIDQILVMPGGTSLKLAGKGIKDLSGLEVFANKGVTWIFLDWNEIEDLTPLSNFENLTKISFSGNEVADLTPLSNIQTLSNITAINNKINTIEPLSNLTDMKYINLDGNNISDISTIQNWSNLTEMSFQNNQISDVPDLSGLKALEQINLSNNKINSIAAIGSPQAVQKFQIDSNNLETLTGIQNCANVKYLSCSNNQITQIAELEALANLDNLNINKNQIQSIESLEQNQQIKYLYTDNNMIEQFGTLENLPNLEKYTMYNQIFAYEIKEKDVEGEVQVQLPQLYSNLYDENAFIHKTNLKTEVSGTENYKIDEANTSITINVEDLKKDDITVKVLDDYNSILQFTIVLEKAVPKIEEEENIGYRIAEDYIMDVAGNTTLETFANTLNSNTNYKIYRNEELIENSSELIATGDKLVTEYDKSFYLIVKGDITKDGITNIKDLVVMRKRILNTEELDTHQEKAADIAEDGAITIKDLVQMRKILLDN